VLLSGSRPTSGPNFHGTPDTSESLKQRCLMGDFIFASETREDFVAQEREKIPSLGM
jgi:hypothetical protein